MPHRRERSRISRLLSDSTGRHLQSPTRRSACPDRRAVVPTRSGPPHGPYNHQPAAGAAAEAYGQQHMSGWHIAQLNVGRILAPTDSPQLAEFMARLDEINALADATPGFVWRLQTASGNATDIRVSEHAYFLVNISVWATIEATIAFGYRTSHAAATG